MSRRPIIIAVVAAVVLAAGAIVAWQLAGDSGTGAAQRHTPPTGRVVQPGAPGSPGRTLGGGDLASIAPPTATLADTYFMQRMIPHHAQALEMTALLKGRTQNADLALLAGRIEVSQRDEIAQMERWLKERGKEVPKPHTNHAGHDTLMPGMLNDQQLAGLAAARNADFDRLFLELMIRHHQGALTMVQELYSAGGGLETDSDRFAREVNADQEIEIRRMRDLLGKL